jgi:hypothetical protein
MSSIFSTREALEELCFEDAAGRVERNGRLADVRPYVAEGAGEATASGRNALAAPFPPDVRSVGERERFILSIVSTRI